MVCVDRCVCAKRSFLGLAQQMRATGLSLHALQEQTGAGQHCGLCIPYLQVMQGEVMHKAE